MRKIHCIAAMDSNRGIGKDGKLPWHLPAEYKYYAKTSTIPSCKEKQNAVIMGKNTYFSTPAKYRPRSNRLNIVLSSTLKRTELPDQVLLEPTLDSAVETMSKEPYVSCIENIFVIGGFGVYKEAMESSYCDRIYLTKVQGDFSCDAFFPEFDERVYKEVTVYSIPQEEQEENGINCKLTMLNLRKVHCLAAMDSKRGIGKDNKLPWHLPAEYKHFVKVSTTVSCKEKQNAVIMGKNTYFSIPEKYRPLRNRLNIVLSSTLKKTELPDKVLLEPTLESAIETMSKEPYVSCIENLFVVGGSGVYNKVMESPVCDRIYLTKIQGDFSCDVFYPEFDESVYKEITVDSISQEEQEENGIKYHFHIYSK